MSRLVVLLLLIGNCAWAEIDASGDVDALRRIARAELQRQQVPGAAVGVLYRGEELLAEGFGEANLEHHVAVTRASLFESGSLGKAFTAVAAMLLVEDGRLALDMSIAPYFAAAPRSWEVITLRQLLTHTSGIPDYLEGAIDYRRDYSDQGLADVAASMPLSFLPGSAWEYSNTGYVLLGQLISVVGGRFYGDQLRERVFLPLGMDQTRLISADDIIAHRVAGYRLLYGELKNREWAAPTLSTTADGSLLLSLDDMLAWLRALRAGRLLSAASWQQVFTPATVTSAASGYGFGWFIDVAAGQRAYWHSGSWLGFENYLAWFPDLDLAIVVLGNLEQGDMARVTHALARTIQPQLDTVLTQAAARE